MYRLGDKQHPISCGDNYNYFFLQYFNGISIPYDANFSSNLMSGKSLAIYSGHVGK